MKVNDGFVNIGRWQFIMWRRWSWIGLHRVKDAPLGYIYSHLGQYGPIEIRRFVALDKVQTPDFSKISAD